MVFTDFDESDRKDAIEFVSARTGLLSNVVEKDWWVTSALRALFSLPYASHISFKGGTNLSKCWNLIHRMSEDVDIAVSREYLGFSGELSKTQISDKLRRASCSFVRNIMRKDVESALLEYGISPDMFQVRVVESKVTTVDPETIFISYRSLYEVESEYIRPMVKIEVSGRSMSEPIEKVDINSLIAKNLPHILIDEPSVNVNAVIPQRTFIEKLFLLHEEFSKPSCDIRVERMSRHLYDVFQILKTNIAEEALKDDGLYQSVMEHRRKFIGLRGFNYDTLKKKTLNIVPQGDIRSRWEEDYKNMMLNMIMDEAPSFDEIISSIEILNDRINNSL